MVLLNRPLTETEMNGILNQMPVMKEFNTFYSALFEPRHQYVRYDAAMGRLIYEDPNVFYWCSDEQPSDCRWMVPGVTPNWRW